MRFVHTILVGIFFIGIGVMPINAWAQNSETTTYYKDSVQAGHNAVLPYEFKYTSQTPIESGNLHTNNPRKIGFQKNFASALGITYDPGRIDFALNATHGKRVYDGRVGTLRAIAAPDNVKQNYTDVEFKAAYALNDNIKPYVAVNVGSHDYEQYDLTSRGFSNSKGDSRNTGIMTGLQFVYKGFIEGFLGLGYEKRSYKSNNIESIGNIKLASELGLNITPKTKLKFGLNRFSTEDRETLESKVVTQGRIQLDYEFLRNMFATAFVSYSYNGYNNFSREQDYISAGTGLRYQLDSGISVSGDYNFEGGDSRVIGPDEDSHEFLLKLNTRF